MKYTLGNHRVVTHEFGHALGCIQTQVGHIQDVVAVGLLAEDERSTEDTRAPAQEPLIVAHIAEDVPEGGVVLLTGAIVSADADEDDAWGRRDGSGRQK